MRKKVIGIAPCVYQVGGGRLSDAEDCLVYLVEDPGAACLIDAGAGAAWHRFWIIWITAA